MCLFSGRSKAGIPDPWLWGLITPIMDLRKGRKIVDAFDGSVPHAGSMTKETGLSSLETMLVILSHALLVNGSPWVISVMFTGAETAVAEAGG